MHQRLTLLLPVGITLILCALAALATTRFWHLGQKRAGFQAGATHSPQAQLGDVTSTWYSSLFFEEWSAPLFAYPLVYEVTETGYTISYPRLNATEKTVFASNTPDLTLMIDAQKLRKEVVAPDLASVGVSLCDEGDRCLRTRFTHGSPVTHFRATGNVRLLITAPQARELREHDNSREFLFEHGRYGMIVRNGSTIVPIASRLDRQDGVLALSLESGETLSIGLHPDDGTLTIQQMQTEVSGTEFSWSIDASPSQRIRATLSYLTTSSDNALLTIALLPHQWQHLTTPPLGSYRSLRGQMKAYQTTTIETQYDTPQALSVTEMIKTLSTKEIELLSTLLEEAVDDAIALPSIPVVYEQGKALFRLSLLLEMSQVIAPEKVPALQDKLRTELIAWLGSAPGSPNSPFLLSSAPKGLIAQPSATQFGNEFFNDHHFHYGYFLASLSSLIDSLPADVRSALIATVSPGLEPMLLDIANTDPTQGYTLLRHFDPYESHSWADGRALAADGNNQESTSEAVHRWYGLMRLGKSLGRTELEKLGKVGWAMEREAAQIYWLGQRPELFSFPAGYSHPIASLVWGGKYDYATWFSDLPSHIYGIQFLPLSPAMTHIINPERWKSYQNYTLSEDTRAWNDLYIMMAVANGQTSVDGQPIPATLPRYEAGNSAPWYYLWTRYFLATNNQ